MRHACPLSLFNTGGIPLIAESAGLPCFSPENRDIFQEKQGGD
jgi:hypothetical protein